MPLFPPSSCPRLIVKIGSALLVDPDGRVRREWLAGIATDIAERSRGGQQVAVVSSGGINSTFTDRHYRRSAAAVQFVPRGREGPPVNSNSMPPTRFARKL